MAKSKKNVDAFQKAMLANTKVIGSQDEAPKTSDENVTGALQLSEKTRKRLTAFVKKHNLTMDETIELAIENFMELEDYWFSK